MKLAERNLSTAIFEDMTKHLLMDEKPSEYINKLSTMAEYQTYPFDMLWMLKETEQSPVHHPEGSVWNHTMLVLDEAALVREQSNDKSAFMWAALLHDIGKPGTTRNRKGKITSYDHDTMGEALSIDFLRAITQEEELIRRVAHMVRYHMHMLYVLKKLPFGDIKGLVKNVDAHEIALLCRCDRLGRTGADKEAQALEYQEFLRQIKQLKSKNSKD